MSTFDHAASLSVFLGCELTAASGGLVGNANAESSTWRGEISASPGLSAGVIAELNLADGRVWALLFAYINGVRVAPSGMDFLVLHHEAGAWRAHGWERDEYGEWEKYSTLP